MNAEKKTVTRRQLRRSLGSRVGRRRNTKHSPDGNLSVKPRTHLTALIRQAKAEGKMVV